MIEEYLKKYSRDEMNLLKWLKQNGVNMLVAVNIMHKYATEDRQFESGYDLDHAILDESLKQEINPYKDFVEAKDKFLEATEAAKGIVDLHKGWQGWMDSNKQLFEKKEAWYKKLWRLMQKPL